MSEPSRVNVLLVPVGSAGDVHPYLGVGLGLRARGHRVTVVTNARFESLTRRLGLEFVALGEKERYDRAVMNPDLWHPRKGIHAIAGIYLPAMPALYEIIRERHVPGTTVVAATGFAFGARLAQEKLGVPLATIHLQPACFRSVHRAPVMHPSGAAVNRLPRLGKRFVYRLADAMVDRVMAPGLNRFRAELGLGPVKRILADWWRSPQRAIGLFPDWFGTPQPDWPPQTLLTGFVQYDEGDVTEMPAEVERFLDEGEPPVAFTPGSAMLYASRFFEASAEACGLAGRRGILLTRYRDQVPKRLPAGVRHFGYAPFGRLLPRVAALVHHGGIGTLAQAMAAGIPQLVRPLAWDQPDNAIRLRDLGVGRIVHPSRYRALGVARALEDLLASTEIAARCRSLAERLHGESPVEETCRAIEALAGEEVLR